MLAILTMTYNLTCFSTSKKYLHNTKEIYLEFYHESLFNALTIEVFD